MIAEDMSATDDELLAALVDWAATPRAILEDPEVRSVFLPSLRADLSIVASCRLLEVECLGVPILSFAGSHDVSASFEMCAAWSEWTSGQFEIHTLTGGHFFPLAQGAALLDHITAMASSIRSTVRSR
jgi:surfactin synthase thioesterase subunit